LHCCSLLAACIALHCCSLFTVHCSLFTAHCSLLTAHCLQYFDTSSGEVSIAYRPIHKQTLDEQECPAVPPARRVY
jgi:hypothetical protein